MHSSVISAALLRVQALLVVLVLHSGIAAVASSAERSRPAAHTAAAASGSTAASVPVGVIAPTPRPTPLKVPSPRKVAARQRAQALALAHRPARHWIPRGTGMWTYLWSRTEGGNARAVVRRAKAAGLTHLYVRTGTRVGGFDGGPVLAKLLPATKGTGISVIAWDFPTLANPRRDAARLAAAARFRVKGKGMPRVMAVAPDIETAAEGTRISARTASVYLTELRRLLPRDVPIFAVVPWPSEKRLGRYPFGLICSKSDAMVPMAYWINRDPATVTRQTMQRLKPCGKPIMPIGQAYDPRIDVPTLPIGPPSRSQVERFLATARRHGAPAVSLWVWQFANGDQWRALAAARHRFLDVRLPLRS